MDKEAKLFLETKYRFMIDALIKHFARTRIGESDAVSILNQASQGVVTTSNSNKLK